MQPHGISFAWLDPRSTWELSVRSRLAPALDTLGSFCATACAGDPSRITNANARTIPANMDIFDMAFSSSFVVVREGTDDFLGNYSAATP
jgi:hypothetical protein